MTQRISVRVPATSANLGCAFDCAALALSLYLDVHASPRKDGEITVRYSGVNADRIPADDSNLIVRTMRGTLDEWNKKRGFDLEIENQIPVGVGLGSSAAAIVASLAASHWLADTTLLDEDLISRATALEGHPDNVAAAWQGGFTVSVQAEGRVLAYSCPVPETLQLVLIVPDYALSTEKARGVLPASYSRPDAVHNLQRAVVLAAQLFAGRADLHRMFFDDRWHQPQRASLMPGLPEILDLQHKDLIGICLSGAGPSILAFVRGSAEAIGNEVCAIFTGKGIAAKAHTLTADNRGGKGWSLPGQRLSD